MVIKSNLVIATICAGLAVAAAPASAGLVGYYDFESSNANDSSGNGNHSTLGASVGFTAAGQGVNGGIAGDFVSVAGTANMVSLPFDIRGTIMPNLTMSAFVRAGAGNGGFAKVLSHDNAGFDRTLGLDTRGGGPGYAAFTGSGVLNSGTAATAGGAYDFIAVRYDGTSVSLTVNGVHFTGTDNTDLNIGFTSLFVGGNPGFNEDWIGQIDNVFVFDHILSDQELDTIDQDGGIRTNEVPVPAAGLLMAGVIALFGAGALRRR